MRRFFAGLGIVSLLTSLSTTLYIPYLSHGISFYTFHSISGLTALKKAAILAFFSGSYPLWNPWILCGVPFHSGIGVLDPLSIPLILKDHAIGMIGASALALFIAGLGMYIYTRRVWGFAWINSFFAGAAYMFCPFFAATSHELPFMAPPIYLPFAMLFYEKSREEGGCFWSALSGTMLGLSFFSGNLESFYFVTLFFVVLQALQCYVLRSRNSQVSILRELRLIVVTVLFAFGIIAIDLIPSLEMIQKSGRSANAILLQNSIHFCFMLALAWLFNFFHGRFDQGKAKKRYYLSLSLLIGIMCFFVFRYDQATHTMNFNQNIFFPDIQKIMINGVDSYHLLVKQTNATGELIASVIPPRFVFYIQPPIYVFTLGTLLLFSICMAMSRHPILRIWGWFAFALVLFPYTEFPNLSHRLLGLNQIAFPRIVFGFYFVLSVMLGYALELIGKFSYKDLRLAILRRISLGLIVVCMIGLIIQTAMFFMKAPQGSFFEALIAFRRHVQEGSGLLAGSLAYHEVLHQGLRLLYSLSPLVYILAALKFLAVIFVASFIYTRSSLSRFVLVLLFVIEGLLGWHLYTFQSTDIQVFQNQFKESSFMRKVLKHERIGTYNQPKINLRSYYDDTHLPFYQGNTGIFFGKRSIEGAALNLSPSRFKEFWRLEPENEFTPSMLNIFPSNVYNLMGLKYLLSEVPVTHESLQPAVRGDRYFIYKNIAALDRFYWPEKVKFYPESYSKEPLLKDEWDPQDISYVYSASNAGKNWIREKEEGRISIVTETWNKLVLRVKTEGDAFITSTDAFDENWMGYLEGERLKIYPVNGYFRGFIAPAGTHEIIFKYRPKYFYYGCFISAACLLYLLIRSFYRKARGIKRV